MLMTLLASAGLAVPGGLMPVDHVDVRTSTFSMSAQSEADLAVSADGSMFSVWSSRRQNGGRYGVFAQRLDSQGVAQGEEFSLSAWRDGHTMSPAVATTSLGTTWGVWQSFEQDGDAGGIFARIFDAQGNASDEILVNVTTRGHQNSPVIAPLPDGGVVIAWQDSPRSGLASVRYRVFGPGGDARSDELRVDGDGARLASPSVASGDNGFAIAWSAFDSDTGEPMGVRVRTFFDDGRAMGDVQTPAPAALSQVEPVVASTRDGYVLAWIDAQSDGDSYGVLATRLDASGSAMGDPVVVNSEHAGVQNAPAIAVRDDGVIAIAYNSDEADGFRGVYARWFDADLHAMGDSAVLSRAVEGDQLLRESAGTRRVAFSPAGDLLCAWSGDAGLGDASSANVTIAGASARADVVRGVREGMCEVALHGATDATAGPHIPPTFNPLAVSAAQEDVRINADGIGFLAVTNTGWTPPDPSMAVGMNHIVVMTNGEIAFFTKDGTNTFRDEIEDSFGFWGSLGTTGFVFDPEVLYDSAEDRFVAMAAEGFEPGNRSHVLIAVSDDGDPNGSWHKYRIETTSLAGDLFDSPNIAVTGDAVIVTGDGFGIGSNYPVFTFDKASLYAGDPPAISRQTTLSTATQSAGIPPTSLPDPGVLYMIEHQEGNNRSRVRLIALSDALGSPSFTTMLLTVPSYNAPADPAQMGTGTRPETFDARFWSVEYVDGSLWATHHVSNPVRARWYEIDMRGWPTSGQNPVLVQSGEAQPDSGTHTFFSSIAAGANGLAAVCYAQSSPSEFISMHTAFRLGSDPLGTMTLGDAQQSNTAPYNNGRWGDYSGCEIDPGDGTTIWSHHEYAVGNSWRTWVASITTDSGCPADLDGDGDADADDFFMYLDLFAAGDPGADLDGDGDRDADDFFMYLDLFSQGC